MVKMIIEEKYPHLTLFLIAAIIIAIPLTVWSLNNVSTLVKIQAQAPKCGPNNQNPSCPTNFKCIFLNNNPVLGGTCDLKSIEAPKNLESNTICDGNKISPNNLNLNLTWDNVVNATSYKIFTNYYYLDRGNIVNVKIGPYFSTTNSFNIKLPIPHGIKFFYWHVKAYSSTYKLLSPISSVSSIVLNCK